MAEGQVQRRGVPQAQAIAERFGQEALGGSTELPPWIIPMAKTTRLDLPCMGHGLMAALAANRSMVQLFNPGDTNTDIYLQRLWCSSTADGNIQLKIHDTALTTNLSTNVALWRREGTSQPRPVAQVRKVQGASVGTVFGLVEVLDNVSQLVDFRLGDGQQHDGLVLQPGRGILLNPGGDNLQINVMFHWLERPTG